MSLEESQPDPPEPTLHEVTDPRIMRALAHPVRIALLEALTLRGPLTATEAGEVTGETPTTCSFHLRQLAKYGFVEEAGGGRGRRRPWRLTRIGLRFSVTSPDPEQRLAASALEQVLRARHLGRLQTWFETRHTYPDDVQEAATSDEYLLYITPDEATALAKDIEGLTERYVARLAPGQHPDAAVPFELLVFTYPIDRAGNAEPR